VLNFQLAFKIVALDYDYCHRVMLCKVYVYGISPSYRIRIEFVLQNSLTHQSTILLPNIEDALMSQLILWFGFTNLSQPPGVRGAGGHKRGHSPRLSLLGKLEALEGHNGHFAKPRDLHVPAPKGRNSSHYETVI
jgi:hypothetical protein